VQANKAGKFEDEVAPIELKSRKGPVSFATDEHPRVTTLDTRLSLLPAPAT